MEKSQNIFNIDQTQLLNTIEHRSLELEIDRARDELEVTEKKTIEFKEQVLFCLTNNQ